MLSLEFGSSDLVCEACGLLGHWLRLREELREMQAVKLLLRMVPPGLWGQFPAAEQRMVPAPAVAWQMVQGSSRPGRPAAHPGRGGQLWCGVRGAQGSAMPSGRGPRLPDGEGPTLPGAASRCAFHSNLVRYLL